MKTAIIYASVHHGNTKKVVDEIAKTSDTKVDLIDAVKVKEKDLNGYDRIGFASGIYYSKFHQSVLNFAAVNLPQAKEVFFLCTYGGKENFQSIEGAIKGKNARVIGRFGCKGYDTYGPFKLIGGISKGHPDARDLADATAFYKTLKTL
ncbi:MAG: flavodoxin family protein [Lachnospiraceae bacterium]